MILLLGASGYIGQAFEQALKQRGEAYVPLSRAQVDYTQFQLLYPYLKANRPSFVINAAGYTGKPNVDACENAKADTLQGNALFPQTLAHACTVLEIPWGHVSSGCIYAGCWVDVGNRWVVEKEMSRPEIRALANEAPARLRGFDEEMLPNFSFRDSPCSFYSGTKALGEEAIAGTGNHYVWRLRIPFDEIDGGRNYLSKLQRYAKVYDNLNSLSHRADYANACLDAWFQKIPFGTYNVTNPGFVSAAEVVEMVKTILKPSREFVFWASDEEFYRSGARAPRSNCLLETSKLLNAGVKMRPVRAALEAALTHWQPERA